ncbi:type I toxin-antitoxin system SymE family toxin [Pedobacter hiemivivus]|uniref:Type I toxin-antitoxin system SymE family toxin n=1 Tax=Pedobacter hiemivivus TaxID=2530454 RepID=A0A4U1FZJ5_9SPHI|nr:type I toxin-antitoxin system SymE family toxin [Pedobacter hiemivivus]
MRTQKNQTTTSIFRPKVDQVKQPNKTCTCGACDPPKPKLPAGMRRLKIQQKFITQVRSSTVVPMITLAGEWLRKSGFEYQSHIIIIEKEGQLIINLDTA